MSDWEDDPVSYSTPASSHNYQEPGYGMNTGKGRGFTANSEWEDNQESSFQNNGFGRDDGNRRGGRGGRGGRGNRGGRGEGRSDRGGRRNNDDYNGRFDNADNDDGDFGMNGDSDRDGFRGRGRGGRGGRGGGDSRTGENGETEKPRERYIPQDRDCEDLFEQNVTAGVNFDKYDSIEIFMTGENKPKPITSFQSSGLRDFVLDNVKKSGYKKPTPVQKYSIPAIMAGRDLMACAQTGSGKTAAFLLPIINTFLEAPLELVYDGNGCQPQAVVMCPTRELAIQIYDEARKFSLGSMLKIGLAYGGAAAYFQASKLKQGGCHILVSTAGRLKDFVERGTVSFSSLRFFVLDEADRMLDMGFLPDIKLLLENASIVPAGERQTLMFSATFPTEIQKLAGNFMKDYLFLTVGITGGACSDVEQNFIKVSKFDKRKKLKELLEEDSGDRILVFVEKKRNADFIAAYLSEQRFPTTSIHGDRQQREREEALNDFRRGRMKVLVATGVANRGLDIKGVSHVVYFDLPKSIDEYVHGIGRTGRVGNRGRATMFYDSEEDAHLAADLIKMLKQTGQEVPSWLESESLGGGGNFSASNFGGKDYRKWDDNPLPVQSTQPVAVDDEEQW